MLCLLLCLPLGAWAQTLNAQFVSQTVPTFMTAGQSYSVTVKIKNTGTAIWTAGSVYKLGSQNPVDNSTWGISRVVLTAPVLMTQTATINFTVRAPSSVGSYNFQWRMINGATWFGGSTSNLVVPVYSAVNTPPSVALTAPTSGATGIAPASFTLNATATDSDDGISRVEFFSSGTLIGTDTAAPYSVTYSGVGVGNHYLTAKATDLRGATTASSTVMVSSTSANPPPTVSLTAPINGATAVAPASFTLTATAASSAGTIDRVYFYSNTVLIATDTTAPYSFVHSDLPAGTYSLQARAVDNIGLFTTTPVTSVTVTAAPPSNVAPTVSLTSPANGATAVAPASFSLAATASDSDGTISQVQFYANGALINTDTVSPYSYTYSGVAAGTYSLTAKATDNLGAVTTSSAISVTSTVPANVAPTVTWSSPANGATGTAPASFTLAAYANDDDGTISQVAFYSNGALINTDTVSPYSYTYSGIAAGTYSLTAKATDNLGAVTTSTAISVTSTVPANVAPTVTWVSPADGATGTAPASFILNAFASDDDGTISQVQFYSNGTLINTDTVPAYNYTYSGVAAGTYSLTAKATDNLGAVTTSTAISVTVTGAPPGNVPPAVSLTSPANGATTIAPASFSLAAAASDGDGTVSQVQFYSNGALINTDTVSPYSYAYSGVAAGTYSLTAKATDNLGAVTTSTAISVTSTVPANAAPTIAWVSPANGASGTAPASFTLTANASDSDGTISQVQFYSNGALINTDTVSPYSYTYSGVAAGTYSLTAQATDNLGAMGASGAISITVVAAPNVAPTVTLTSPGNGSVIAAPATFSLAATASDSDGAINQVQFYANGTLINTDTAAPYAYTYSGLGSGTYSFTARATDNLGLSAVTSAATATVSGAQSLTRTYVYDGNERLCKTINPESGATIVDYDAAGNIAWSVDGSNLTAAVCDRDLVPIGARTSRSYDAMNRLTAVSTPGGNADLITTYYADGAVNTLTVANPGGNSVVTSYTYNKRRLLTGEASSNGVALFPLGYGYNANGHLSALTYPDGQTISTAPDALGRATLVASTTVGGPVYASNIAYYPSGAISGFTYGNGIVHTMTQVIDPFTQKGRPLPERSRDVIKDENGVVTATILDDSYAFDENGNVTDIIDRAQAGKTTRGMSYDGLDRLSVAVSPGQWGDATYGYDVFDNLTFADQGTRKYRYRYTNQHLTQINDDAGVEQFVLSYDAQGNVASKNSQAYVFDSANRLNQVTGQQTYRYDGQGRRVQTTDADGGTTFWIYSQSGQVLYTSEARRNQNLSYIYLGNTQVATRTVAWGSGIETIRYQHTDALGSIVAETSVPDPTTGAVTVLKRNSYAPYGEAYAPTVIDGTGYTGHVMDQATGLTYMQQRYYDPAIGRFLSVDPANVETSRARNFNRYSYGMENPFGNIDPDGREVMGADEARRKYGLGTKGLGHHWIPFGSLSKIDVSSEARSVFGQSVSGVKLPNSEHNVAHPKYNDAVAKELVSYAKREGMDLSKMTKSQAQAFISHVRASQVPDVRNMVTRVSNYTERMISLGPLGKFLGGALVATTVWNQAQGNLSIDQQGCRSNPVCDAERIK